MIKMTNSILRIFLAISMFKVPTRIDYPMKNLQNSSIFFKFINEIAEKIC